MSGTEGEVPMAAVLERYSQAEPLRELAIHGWQDAGDEEALAKVVRDGWQMDGRIYAQSWS